jgi:N6-L-threonylcarbamoyladenine synthase
MRSNLSVGLDTGKALSVAWQIPMVGVHHMQAHLLTPRLVSCLDNAAAAEAENKKNGTSSDSGGGSVGSAASPSFPFLSILVSGGHSILVHSKSLVNHKIMASSEDIAIGEALDKSAREIIPAELLSEATNTMYAKTLEKFVFPNGAADFADYNPPLNRGEEVANMKKQSGYGWSVTVPFANTRALQLSFSSIASMVNKIVKARGESLSHLERVELGRETMRVCFEHLASRTIIALEQLRLSHVGDEEVKTLVVSGGVAANRFLMAVLRSFLDVRGFGDVRIVAPPPFLCTDNAAMIGWAGIEMFEAGWETSLGVRALRKWTLDPEAEDGGVLGPGGWVKRDLDV